MVQIKSPSVAIENKIAYMPKDRPGVFILATSIKDNISMASLNKVKGHLFHPKKKENWQISMLRNWRLRCRISPICKGNLSGGNKQKL